jgi:hypothetical protein
MQAERSLRIASHPLRLPVRQDFLMPQVLPCRQFLFVAMFRRSMTCGYENQALRAFCDNYDSITNYELQITEEFVFLVFSF